jgi:hypothetical protein
VLVRLIGGPHHGRRFEMTDARDVVETIAGYDDEFARVLYLARKFVVPTRLNRKTVLHQVWKVYLWSELAADDATAAEYLSEIVGAPPDDEGMRLATPAELAQWDDEHRDDELTTPQGSVAE